MKIIVCVDNQNGMMFNHRRQSQDRVLRKRIMELTGGKKTVDECIQPETVFTGEWKYAERTGTIRATGAIWADSGR